MQQFKYSIPYYFCRNAGLQLVKRSRSWSKATKQIYSPCKLGRLRARYNHALENVYALATNFTSDWRKLFNPRCYIGIGVGARALQGRKYVRSESGRRCNRSLPKPPLLLVTREVVRHDEKKTSWRDEERRETAAKKEKQRELSSGTAWSSILLVHGRGR